MTVSLDLSISAKHLAMNGCKEIYTLEWETHVHVSDGRPMIGCKRPYQHSHTHAFLKFMNTLKFECTNVYLWRIILICLVYTLWFSCSQTCFNYLVCQSFNIERTRIKVIAEIRRAH
jgi:hypothetical protein